MVSVASGAFLQVLHSSQQRLPLVKQQSVGVTRAELSLQLTSCRTRRDLGLASYLTPFLQQGLQNLLSHN